MLPFWVFLGLVQWLYLAPLALLLERLGSTGFAKGLWIGGVLAALLNGAYWAGLGLYVIHSGIQSREIQKFAREHPITDRVVAGTVVALDKDRILVQTADEVVSIGLRGTTHYIQSNGPFGNTQMDPSHVKVGVTVVVDASSFDGGPLYADYVSMALPLPDESPAPR